MNTQKLKYFTRSVLHYFSEMKCTYDYRQTQLS